MRLPFFVYAATLAVAGVIAVGALSRAAPPEQADPATGPVQQRTSVGEALRDRSYRAALLTNVGSGWALFGVRSSLIPLFVVEGLRRGPEWTGVGFVLGSAAQALLLLPAGRFTDERGRKPAMVLGCSLATGSMVLLALSPTVPTYLVAMALFGVGAAFLGVAPAAVVGDTVRGRGGTVVAFFQMAADFGAIVGPLVAGWLADSVSFGAAWASVAAVLAVGLVASATMPRRPAPHS